MTVTEAVVKIVLPILVVLNVVIWLLVRRWR